MQQWLSKTISPWVPLKLHGKNLIPKSLGSFFLVLGGSKGHFGCKFAQSPCVIFSLMYMLGFFNCKWEWIKQHLKTIKELKLNQHALCFIVGIRRSRLPFLTTIFARIDILISSLWSILLSKKVHSVLEGQTRVHKGDSCCVGDVFSHEP